MEPHIIFLPLKLENSWVLDSHMSDRGNNTILVLVTYVQLLLSKIHLSLVDICGAWQSTALILAENSLCISVKMLKMIM